MPTPLLSIDDALRLCVENAPILPDENQILSPNLLGKILANPVFAALDLPRYRQSALDGFAFHQNDFESIHNLNLLNKKIFNIQNETQSAGAPNQYECQPQHALRVFTGGRLANNAGAVIGQEHTRLENGQLILEKPLALGANIREQAEECAAGTELAAAGQAISPELIAVFAMAGVQNVCIKRTPRVVILVTGDEVMPFGTGLTPTQIPDSNGIFLASACLKMGLAMPQVHYLPDDPAKIRAAIYQAQQDSDLIISTGGVSVGARDYVIECAENLGARRLFWRVAQKPGKPIYAARLNETFFLGLPGNPGAVLMGWHLYAKTILRAMQSNINPLPQWEGFILENQIKSDNIRTRLVRAEGFIDSNGVNKSRGLAYQESHMLTNLSTANILLNLPAQDAPYLAGEMVKGVRI